MFFTDLAIVGMEFSGQARADRRHFRVPVPYRRDRCNDAFLQAAGSCARHNSRRTRLARENFRLNNSATVSQQPRNRKRYLRISEVLHVPYPRWRPDLAWRRTKFLH